MKKGQILTIALAAAVTAVFTGCNREGPYITEHGRTAIRFSAGDAGANWGGSGPSAKAGAVTESAFHADFGVYAYFKESARETPLLYMDGIRMIRKGEAWGPASASGQDSLVYYWPDFSEDLSDSLTFYAYAPYTAPEGGITVEAAVPAAPVLTYHYDSLYRNGQQTDLVYADTAVTAMPASGKQDLRFSHALSRIDIQVQAKRGTVDISSLEVSGKFFASGALDLSSGSWSGCTAPEEAFVYTADNTVSSVGTDPVRVSFEEVDGDCLLVIPTAGAVDRLTLKTRYTAGSSREKVNEEVQLGRVAPAPGSYVKVTLTYGDNLYLTIEQAFAGSYYNHYKMSDFEVGSGAGKYFKLDWSEFYSSGSSAGSYRDGNAFMRADEE